MILFNNKEILVEGKPIFISEWLHNVAMFCLYKNCLIVMASLCLTQNLRTN